jgi:hypothetical protein
MLIGYARVSTDDQDLRLQRAALLEVGCKRVFEEKVSGASVIGRNWRDCSTRRCRCRHASRSPRPLDARLAGHRRQTSVGGSGFAFIA